MWGNKRTKTNKVLYIKQKSQLNTSLPIVSQESFVGTVAQVNLKEGFEGGLCSSVVAVSLEFFPCARSVLGESMEILSEMQTGG